MNPLTATLARLDRWQQSHRLPAFIYAVIKRYGEDQTGYQAALFTYYAFLSLFPLLLVLTTITNVIAGSYPGLQHSILQATTNYFPVLGNQLSSHVQGSHKTGVALLIGILFTLYGARGVADAFRNGVNHTWGIPLTDRDGFPKSVLKSLAIVVVGGFGLILASILSSLAASAGHSFLFPIVSLLINIGILFLLFCWLINISLPNHVTVKDIRSGALTAAIGLVILQTFGALVLKHELKSLDAVYSYFAIALGLLFWLYLQAQVIYYAVTVAAVHTQHLWPRSLINKPQTKVDKRSIERLSKTS